jgi:hypothetical protein
MVILANTLCLALEHHNMPKALEEGLYNANVAFTLIFNVELFLKVRRSRERSREEAERKTMKEATRETKKREAKREREKER